MVPEEANRPDNSTSIPIVLLSVENVPIVYVTETYVYAPGIPRNHINES